MKTLTFLAIALATLILPVTLKAGSIEKETDAIDSIMLNYSTDISEDELCIEPWMVNDNVWKAKTSVSNEQELNIEKWMTDDQVWKLNGENQFKKPQVEDESKLVIQKWMIDSKTWRL